MQKIESYKDLFVWQRGIEISVAVYKLSNKFPESEMFGLTSQLRRAANSISLNIAEGFGRNSTKGYINYLRIAKGSLDELESGLFLAEKLNFVTSADIKSLNESITQEMKMLVSLINTLKQKTKTKLPDSLNNLERTAAVLIISLGLSLFPIHYLTIHLI
jgi:four helix bundle protein